MFRIKKDAEHAKRAPEAGPSSVPAVEEEPESEEELESEGGTESEEEEEEEEEEKEPGHRINDLGYCLRGGGSCCDPADGKV